MTSLSSEFSISTVATHTPPQSEDPETFQNRRRRAAKLTQFFGVDYRDLMSEILDSIERGVEEEGGRGSLKPDEVQVSLHIRFRWYRGLMILFSTGSAAEVEEAEAETKQSFVSSM